MAASDDPRTLERQLFFHGQRLLADDLNEVVAAHRARREAHNRFLHQSGVGSGFEVNARRGEREVTVGAGYALDALGQEIISTRTRVEPVPPVAGDPDGGPARYDLTVSYPSEEDLEEAETREGVCLPRGVVRLAEEPVLCWVRLEEDATGQLHPVDPALAAEIEAGMKVRLARVEVEQCCLKSLSIAERRDARPPALPYVACGRAQPEWEVEPIVEASILFSAGFLSIADVRTKAKALSLPAARFFLTASIDASAAGFRAIPCYSAGLRGPRRLRAPSTSENVPSPVEMFGDGLVSIEDPGPNGFRLRVLPFLFVDANAAPSVDWERLEVPWAVEWMGVEGRTTPAATSST